MNKSSAKDRLVSIVRTLAVAKRDDLERLKEGHNGLARPDFIWHYLLQSFATMGRASGWHGLIENQENYSRVTYEALASLPPRARAKQVRQVCRDAKIRMPDRKASFILGCFDHVKQLGGPKATKQKLLALPGRAEKVRFLRFFPGIGPKYARNIMMDVYHEDFRDSIAIDARIRAISDKLGLSFQSYDDHEEFYLEVARLAGLEGWELDRLLFNFRPEVEAQIGGDQTVSRDQSSVRRQKERPNADNLTPGKKAHHTAKWARTMTKWLVTRNRRTGAKWKLVDFGGKTGSEARGIVDLIAIRKNHRESSTGLKRGDLFEIVLIQTKGGSAPRPTSEDLDRLSIVARYHRAKAVVLAEWRRREKLDLFVLRRRKWHPVTPVEIFG